MSTTIGECLFHVIRNRNCRTGTNYPVRGICSSENVVYQSTIFSKENINDKKTYTQEYLLKTGNRHFTITGILTKLLYPSIIGELKIEVSLHSGQQHISHFFKRGVSGYQPSMTVVVEDCATFLLCLYVRLWTPQAKMSASPKTTLVCVGNKKLSLIEFCLTIKETLHRIENRIFL